MVYLCWFQVSLGCVGDLQREVMEVRTQRDAANTLVSQNTTASEKLAAALEETNLTLMRLERQVSEMMKSNVCVIRSARVLFCLTVSFAVHCSHSVLIAFGLLVSFVCPRFPVR